MNKENILRVADAIERGELVDRDIGFNMSAFANRSGFLTIDKIAGCGTVACIAGWAYTIKYPSTTAARLRRVALNGSRSFREDPFDERIPTQAAQFLGLDRATAKALFGIDTDLDLFRITAARAVAVLRHLAETGKVDWSIPDPGAAA